MQIPDVDSAGPALRKRDMAINPLELGSVAIGDGLPPLFLPDIDVYFKDDIDSALSMVDHLADLGLPILKGAFLQRPDLCLDVDVETSYFIPGQGLVSEPYRKIIERHVVSKDALQRIYGRARDRGLDVIISVYDEEGIQLATRLGAVALKIPSSNIVHAPLIRSVASARLPVLIDTGRSSMAEIDRAVGWARAAGASAIVVQHSPPAPPAPASDFHLRMMLELGRRHQCCYGLSDHFAGTEMMLIAAALGAHVVEKGICPDGTAPDIDISHALPLSKVGHAVEGVRMAYEAMGNPVRTIPAMQPRPRDRMGLVAARDLEAGDPIDVTNVTFAFPTLGVPVEDWDDVDGRRLRSKVCRGHPIRRSDIEDHG